MHSTKQNNANEDHGKLSAATLFVFLFVFFVPTFNVLVSTLVDVCAHSALYSPVSATLSLFSQPFAFSFTLYMPVFVFVSNLFVCVNCVFVQLCLSAHSVPFCHCCVFLPSCLSAHGVFVSTLLVLFVPTLGVCVYSSAFT